MGRSQLVWRDPPVLPVGLPGCGPPILARDRPICSMARGTADFRREETCALGCPGHSAPAGEPAGRPRAAGRSSGPIPAPGGNGPSGPTPPTRAGPPGAAARGSVETGRDLRAGPAQGGWRTWGRLRGREYAGGDGGEALQPGRGRRRKPVPGAQREAASSPCTAGERASTGRTGNRNPDRATATARRTYPSAEPQPRAG